MKKIIVIIGLLYVGYTYGDQISSIGSEMVDRAKPTWEQLQEFLEK